MTLLAGKRALVVGVANHRSIAWGIARALHEAGAEVAFTYLPVTERWVRPLAESLGSPLTMECDVTKDAQIDEAFRHLQDTWGTFDILVHSIAWARPEDLKGEFLDTSREGFHQALDVSAYSLVALAKHAVPRMNPGGSIVTMTYHGSTKVVPHYNVMGVAKAALEASVRYLAADLGPRGIRVNAISAGPIRTLAAAGISGFKTMLESFAEAVPMRRAVTPEDVGSAAVFLCSAWAGAVTGEVMHVDSGANILGAVRPS